jgi:hypothetical protein
MEYGFARFDPGRLRHRYCGVCFRNIQPTSVRHHFRWPNWLGNASVSRRNFRPGKRLGCLDQARSLSQTISSA